MHAHESLIAELRDVFSARTKPTEWLRKDLSSIDRLDGQEFVDSLESGGAAREWFVSAIPYFSFLVPGAAAYVLPDFLETAADDNSQLAAVFVALDNDHGALVMETLHDAEREVISRLFSAIQSSSEFPPEIGVLSELQDLLQQRTPAA